MDKMILKVKMDSVVIESIECKLREVPMIMEICKMKNKGFSFTIQEVYLGELVGDEIDIEEESEFGI